MTTLTLVLASTLTLLTPENGVEYDTYSPLMNEFFAHYDERGVKPEEPPLNPDECKQRDEQNAKYDAWVKAGKPKGGECKPYKRMYFDFYIRNPWTKEHYERLKVENRNYKPFTWKADFKVSEAWVEFSETEDFAKPLVEHMKYGRKPFLAIRPGYLKLGVKYFWRVRSKDAEGKEVVSDVRTFTTKDGFPRFCDNFYNNIRDIGGGTNRDGKRIRQGMLYHGTQAPTHEYDSVPSTIEYLKSLYMEKLGCVGELDLRSQAEGDAQEKQWNIIQLDKIGLKRACIAMEDYHIEHPKNYDAIPKCIHYLADKNNYPVYVHCAAGADRTGTLFMIINGILGRTDRQIIDEYEASSLNPWIPRFRYSRKPSGLLRELSGGTSAYGGKNISENAEKYLLKIGVPQAEIDAIREIMIEK